MAHSNGADSAPQQRMGALSARGPGRRAGSATTKTAQLMVSGISGVTGVDVPSLVMEDGKGEHGVVKVLLQRSICVKGLLRRSGDAVSRDAQLPMKFARRIT